MTLENATEQAYKNGLAEGRKEVEKYKSRLRSATIRYQICEECAHLVSVCGELVCDAEKCAPHFLEDKR